MGKRKNLNFMPFLIRKQIKCKWYIYLLNFNHYSDFPKFDMKIPGEYSMFYFEKEKKIVKKLIKQKKESKFKFLRILNLFSKIFIR